MENTTTPKQNVYIKSREEIKKVKIYKKNEAEQEIKSSTIYLYKEN